MTRTTSDVDGCGRVRAAVQRGDVDAPDVVGHAASCEACGALLAAPGLQLLLGAADAAEMPDPLARAILARVAAEPAPSRRSARLVVAALGLVGAGAVFGLARVRPDLGAVPVGRAVVLLSVLGASAGMGVWLVARPPWRAPLGPARRGVALGVMWTLPALSVALPLAAPSGVGVFHVATLACLGFGSVMVVLSAAVLGALFRRDTLLGARWPLAAATGALLGNLSLVLHCSLSDVGHVLVSHVGLGVLAAAVAALGSAMWPPFTPAGVAR